MDKKTENEMIQALRETYRLLSSGYIANDSVAADRERLKLESKIKAVLSKLEA
jgi:hypothetical protein